MDHHHHPDIAEDAATIEADRQVLHGMGYAQELLRGMRTFQNFAISFSIICILAGGINSFSQGLSSVGGASIGIGWPIATVVSLLFALAMGQIGSAYPTAGGLYHWASILGGRGLGWITAWTNLFGLISVLAAVNVSAYQFFVGSLGPALGLNVDALTQSPPTFYAVAIQTVAIVAITCSQALFNHLGIRLTSKLTDISGYLIFFTSVALVAGLLLYAPHLDVSRLWSFQNFSGKAGGDVWPKTGNITYLFLLGLLLPAFTITGFDASAHTAEETIGAAKAIPKGMIHSVLWSGVFGWAMLIAIVLAAPSIEKAAGQGSSSFFWIMGQVVPSTLRIALYVLIFLCQYLCGLATVTSVSRMAFAFARDGGLPWSHQLRHVSHRYRTPVAAIWAASLLSIALTVYTPVYTTLAAVCAMFIYISYLLPVAAGLFAYRRTWTKMGAFDLGNAYRPIAVLCIVGCAVLIYIGIQPPNDKSIQILIGTGVLTGAFWFTMERRRFQGPPIGRRIEELQIEIDAAEHAVEEPE
ncbi:MAG: amino acid permease [Fimbriimonas sp.]|nr:amino acid permease [Fimbriimonas sp.]